MITKAELEKMVDSEAIQEFNGTTCTDSNRNAFKYGCSYVTGILMPEIEALNNVKILYHALIHEWDETCEDDCNSYAHNELCKNVDLGNAKRSLQKELSEAKAKIEYLKSGVHTCHDQCPKPICVKFRDKDATIQSLKDENEELKSRVEIGLYNLELRTKENQSIIDNQDETKWAYWRKRSGEMTDAWRDQRDLALTLTAKVKRYEEALGKVKEAFEKELSTEYRSESDSSDNINKAITAIDKALESE